MSATHSCETHRVYLLSCEDFDELLGAAGGCCQRCGIQTSRPCVDHDHNLGRGGVRGIVCPECNNWLGRLDAGAEITELDIAYLANAWHLGRTIRYAPDRRTPARTIHAPDPLWERAKEVTAERGETISDVVRRALERYVRSKK